MITSIIRILLLFLLIYIGVAAKCGMDMMALEKMPVPTVKEPAIYQAKHGTIEVADRRTLLAMELEDKRDQFYPWIKILDDWMFIVLIALVAGYWGGFVRDYYDYYSSKNAGTNSVTLNNNVWIGLILGPSMLAILYAISNVMLTGEWDYRLGPLFGFIFIASLFSERTFEWVKSQSNNYFNNGTKSEKIENN